MSDPYNGLSRRVLRRLMSTSSTSGAAEVAERYGLILRPGAPVLFRGGEAPELRGDDLAALLVITGGNRAVVFLPAVEGDDGNPMNG